MRQFILFLLLGVSIAANSQGFLKAKGTRIVDASGKNILLRGMGLGGWMLQEPYMLKLSGAASAQFDIRNKITALIGEERTQQFYDAWLSNHCTKADIDSLASWGFNSVRLPMHYNLFTLPVEKEPVPGKNTWLTKGFGLTDSLLSWCASNKIYLILDLHAAPGGQGNDHAISDRNPAYPSLWDSPANQQKTIALWVELAKKYKDEKWIGAYDLINEPNWGFVEGQNKNGCDEKQNAPLLKLTKDITAAIRRIDKNHIIIVEGNCWGNNYEGMFPLWDDNLVLSFHKYWNYNDKASIQKFLDYRNKYQVPVWLGETGENSNAWFSDMISLVEKNNIGWAMWPLKKSGINNPLQVLMDEPVKKLFMYFETDSLKPDADFAFNALMQFAENTNIKKNVFRKDVVDAMMKQPTSPGIQPFKNSTLSSETIVFATDYDLGRSGHTYHDKDSAEYWVSTNVRTGWNKGSHYRNDGVDIEECKDQLTNGYNVGWIQTGEWLQYSVYTPTTSEYNISIRSAAKEKAGTVKLIINDKPAGMISIPHTGDDQKWSTTTIKKIKLNKGWNRLRVLAAEGGFNLNYLQFQNSGSTARFN